MKRREFIAGLGGAAAAAAIGGAALWRYVVRAHRGDRVRAQIKILRTQSDTAPDKTASFISERLRARSTIEGLAAVTEPL